MTIQELVRERLLSAVKELFGFDLLDLAIEVPPRTALGDLAYPVAFELAKRLKAATGERYNPREIADRLAGEIKNLPGVDRVETAGAGYINVYLDRAKHLRSVLEGGDQPKPAIGGKLIVEHTAVNPNKAAHIGHLRNAVLGDTIVRLLRAAGESVEIQNYIDNTGVQVADVIVGFKYLDGKDLEQVKAIGGKFDYYCWDLYAQVGRFYEEDPAKLELRSKTLHEIEGGEGDTYELAEHVSTRILNCHLDTMERLGIEYDLLPRESDVLKQKIWERAFSLMKERGAIEYAADGRLAGCWVMRFGDEAAGRDEESEHEADKVIVRSNGTVTYTGKDIALHLWKLGQLGLDFYYKPFRAYSSGHAVWVTTSSPQENDRRHPQFGNGAAYFNVIDIGQSYPQECVKKGVMAIDRDRRVERSAHLGYEKVVLSSAAAEELGQRLSEGDAGRKSVSMSGRKGLGVKADDLIDKLETNALAEVAARHPDLSEDEQHATAHNIAIGALRYFLLKYSRTSIISFDFKDALSFEGETGPYIQYSVVRANSIFRKLTEAGLDPSGSAINNFPEDQIRKLLSGEEGEALWSLVYLASRLDEVIKSAVSALEPAIAAKWTFQIAQNFNLFYHNYHILSEADPARRALLVAITTIVRRQLIRALDLLGILAPERM